MTRRYSKPGAGPGRAEGGRAALGAHKFAAHHGATRARLAPAPAFRAPSGAACRGDPALPAGTEGVSRVPSTPMTGPASSLQPRRPTARRRAGRSRHSISAARGTLFLRSSAAGSRARNGSARPALAPPLLALAPPHSPPPLPFCARAALELAPLLPPLPLLSVRWLRRATWRRRG